MDTQFEAVDIGLYISASPANCGEEKSKMLKSNAWITRDRNPGGQKFENSGAYLRPTNSGGVHVWYLLFSDVDVIA
jgi:hypothetical protein